MGAGWIWEPVLVLVMVEDEGLASWYLSGTVMVSWWRRPVLGWEVKLVG